jgi:hypothetical protein
MLEIQRRCPQPSPPCTASICFEAASSHAHPAPPAAREQQSASSKSSPVKCLPIRSPDLDCMVFHIPRICVVKASRKLQSSTAKPEQPRPQLFQVNRRHISRCREPQGSTTPLARQHQKSSQVTVQQNGMLMKLRITQRMHRQFSVLSAFNVSPCLCFSCFQPGSTGVA